MGYPNLTDMTNYALGILGKSPHGFFIMIEGGMIDQAAHLNLTGEMTYEVAEFSNAVSAALSWAKDRDNVLIIVTADHETGGLTVVSDNGKGNLPAVTWGTTGHTARNVDLFAWGFGAERFSSVTDNTMIQKAILP
jgi:alkaline phosphatase